TSFRSIAAGAAMLAGMTCAVKKNLEYADSIAKTADRIGITTKALQEYRYVADRCGVATNKLDSGLEAFSKRLGDLRMGSGTLYTILDKNNQALKAQLIAADNTTEALDIYFDALKNTENQNDRAALSAAAFGRQAGVGMTLMIDKIDILSERFERLGVEIDEKLLREAEVAGDNIDDLGLVIRNSLNRALIALGPSLGQIAADMATWVAKNKEFIGQDIPDKIRDMAEATKDFTDSPAFRAMVEYWELAAGAAIGFKMGGPTGALIGAGAGGWISAYKDIREMTKKELPEALKKAQQELQILQEEMLRAEKGKSLYSVAYLNKEISQTESRIADMERRLAEATAATEKKAPAGKPSTTAFGTVDTTDIIDEGTDAIQKQIEALKIQRDTFGMTSKEASLYHLKMQGATQAQLELAESILDTIAAQEKESELLKEEGKLREEIYQWIVNSDVAIEEMRQASIEGAKESIAALNEIVDVGKDQFEELKQSIEGWGRDSADAIVQFARTGEMSFSDMIDSMIRDLLRMMVYQNITKPLFGFVGGLFANAHGNAFQNGNVIPFAKGGIVSRPTIFPMAQGAGLMGEAGPEAILPLTRIGGDLGVKADVGPSPDPQPMHVGEGRGIRIVNVLDKSIINDWARSPQGEKIIMNYIYKSGYGGQNNGL
ncbi:MAG: phage tail tape measure C-terminal domain-containing protein, partial [Aliarcobacter sp.]